MTLYQSLKQYDGSPKTALYFRSESISYSSLIKRVDSYADKLVSLGITENTVVSILAPNVPETVIALYALNKIGAIVTILHPLIPPSMLLESLRETKSWYLLILDARYHSYENELKSFPIPVFFLTAYPDLKPLIKLGFKIGYHKSLTSINKEKYLYLIQSPKRKFKTNTDDQKPSVYLRSGGTTGKSKTVILNDTNILYPGSQSEIILNHDLSNVSMIGLLPMFHGFGLSMGIVAPLMNQAASCLMIKFNSNEIIRKIKQGKLNVLITIPYMTEKLLANKHFKGKMLQKIYATYIGSDKPDPRLFNHFNDLMEEYGSQNRLLEGYGLTETVTVNFVNTLSNNKTGSVGKPLHQVRFRICKDNDYRNDIGPNKVGQILISSPTVCLGYLNTKQEDQPFYIDADDTRYLITGDEGYYDSDGYLFFKNREHEVYKIAGYNIFPTDIEQTANKVKGVKQAVVLFHENKNHPYLSLIIISDKTKDDSVLIKDVKDYLEKKLIKYALPEKTFILESLPHTAIGKIDKAKLICLGY